MSQRTVCVCQTLQLTHEVVLPEGCDPLSDEGRRLVADEADRVFALHLAAVRELPGDFEWYCTDVLDAETDEALWDVG